MLRQPGLEGLFPLLTLTQDGARPEIVDEMISDLVRVEKQDLLPIAYSLAGLVFSAHGKDTNWLRERFKPLLNLFEDSWTYQEMVAEKIQEGRQEVLRALRETFVRYVQKNFPILVDLTKQQTSVLTDIDCLRGAFDAVMDATTTTEVEAILMHLSDETQSTQ